MKYIGFFRNRFASLRMKIGCLDKKIMEKIALCWVSKSLFYTSKIYFLEGYFSPKITDFRFTFYPKFSIKKTKKLMVTAHQNNFGLGRNVRVILKIA